MQLTLGMTDSGATVLPYGCDPIAVLADDLLDRLAAQLPDLEQCLILLPDAESARRMRQELLEKAGARGHTALLGPRIHSLREWVRLQPIQTPSVISDQRRELMLVDALRAHRNLYGQGNVWALADTLLELFDELTLNRIGLPRDLPTFRERVARGYGLDTEIVSALGMETRIVHTLWHAWHEQMQAQNCIDRNGAYLLRLGASLDSLLRSPVTVFAIAAGSYNRTETQWLQELVGRENVRLYCQGRAVEGATSYLQKGLAGPIRLKLGLGAPAEPASTRSRFLDAAFDSSASLAERARAYTAYQEEANSGLWICVTGNGEEEALAVELQVRLWLHEGKQDVAIVTENRRLARRIRALLERGGIALQDRAGWALSTTSAAATLERWLECIEEDFPHQPMLDLLKSPFAFANRDSQSHLAAVYRLEQDLVLNENIGRGLNRYQTHLRYRCERLPPPLSERLADEVGPLLQHLSDAVTPVLELVNGEAYRPSLYIERLLESLRKLGIQQAFEIDAAGLRLLEELGALAAADCSEIRPFDWFAFRGWLGRTLEKVNFQPPESGSRVRLLNLEQARLGRFEAIVLAGAEREYLPGPESPSPFFNDGVRRELGLSDRQDKLAERFHAFRALLEAAPRVLITYRREQDGEEIIPSPWVELLRTFHESTSSVSLTPGHLVALLDSGQSQVRPPQPAPLPQPTKRPRAQVDPRLIPKSLSASAYQELVDCPYRFFSGRMLGLAPPEAIKEALEKSDYGERVHRCLEAFHQDVGGLPGPFPVPLTQAHRQAATELLEHISTEVFARDLEDNFLHRGWLARWRKLIPQYIDWQIRRNEEAWRVAKVEVQIQRDDVIPGIALKGRIDRIDQRDGTTAIIDYKTGAVPDEQAVLSGESVQLPFYALLSGDESVEAIEFLQLEREQVRVKQGLHGEALTELTRAVGDRLDGIIRALRKGAGLTAWGDDVTCSRCRHSGICRKDQWVEELS